MAQTSACYGVDSMLSIGRFLVPFLFVLYYESRILFGVLSLHPLLSTTLAR